MKTLLQGFTVKFTVNLLVLLLITIWGARLHTFWGGVFAGAAGSSIVLILVGKAIFASTIARMDNDIKDHTVNS